MRANTAFGRQNAFGGDHAAQVFGRGLVADQQHFFALLCGGDGAFRVEVHFAGGRSRPGRQSFGNAFGRFDGFAVEHRRKHLVQLVGRHAANGRLPVDQPFLFHFDGKANSSQPGALSIASLKHEDLALLDREFEILHVFEMALQDFADSLQLIECFRQMILQLRHRLRRANARDHVFTLRVDQEFAIEDLFSCCRIAREGYA